MGSIPSSITWSQSQNVINVMSVSVVDFQEQIPMIISAERYSDPSNRRKVIQATKEKESKEILANITVDKVHHSKAQDDKQQLQLIPTNPKERVINSPILLLKTQVPNLPVTLHQEEPSTSSKQIAKLNPCDVHNLGETLVHSGF